MKGILKKLKTRQIILIAGTFVLSFIILLAAATIAVAVINVLLNDYNFDAYTIAFIAMTALALLCSFAAVITAYIMLQKSQNLIDSLGRVASGDYSARIDYSRGDIFRNVYKNFNKMTRELKAAKTVRDEFVSTLSHEIKTPLFSIQGFANLLLEGGLTEDEEKKFLHIISDEAGRLARLAENAMLLTKVESQEFSGGRELIKLDAQINDCIIMLERGWTEKKLDVSSDLEPVKLYGDGEMLKQVWLNLLSNAVKFTPEGGKIEVGLRREGDFAVATFKDTGAGISGEDLPKIFEKHFRSRTAGDVDGSGLGLAICKRICALSGGDISAESVLGAGSTFTVKLPVNT